MNKVLEELLKEPVWIKWEGKTNPIKDTDHSFGIIFEADLEAEELDWSAGAPMLNHFSNSFLWDYDADNSDQIVYYRLFTKEENEKYVYRDYN